MKYFSQFLGLAAICWLLCYLVQGCRPVSSAEPPARAEARAVVVALAEGVKALDIVCATVGEARHDAVALDRCAVAYREGRASLLLAEAALDVADAPSAACAAAPGLVALRELVDVVRSLGGTVPPVAVDGLELAGAFAGLVTCDPGDGGRE